MTDEEPDAEESQELRAERDTLAAALAEVAEVAGWVCDSLLSGDNGCVDDAIRNAAECQRALTALPADLAAERFRRERAEALEAAADAIERGSVLSQYGAHGWLRARAADERGAR